ncbi:MAG: hypothetical protein J3K34DRAFT_525723 [Monoraphidium minutum]|nr:MAG: hypothetical protein J3K34DRAFT_525723 [Monoraphidium minutum]
MKAHALALAALVAATALCAAAEARAAPIRLERSRKLQQVSADHGTADWAARQSAVTRAPAPGAPRLEQGVPQPPGPGFVEPNRAWGIVSYLNPGYYFDQPSPDRRDALLESSAGQSGSAEYNAQLLDWRIRHAGSDLGLAANRARDFAYSGAYGMGGWGGWGWGGRAMGPAIFGRRRAA